MTGSDGQQSQRGGGEAARSEAAVADAVDPVQRAAGTVPRRRRRVSAATLLALGILGALLGATALFGQGTSLPAVVVWIDGSDPVRARDAESDVEVPGPWFRAGVARSGGHHTIGLRRTRTLGWPWVRQVFRLPTSEEDLYFPLREEPREPAESDAFVLWRRVAEPALPDSGSNWAGGWYVGSRLAGRSAPGTLLLVQSDGTVLRRGEVGREESWITGRWSAEGPVLWMEFGSASDPHPYVWCLVRALETDRAAGWRTSGVPPECVLFHLDAVRKR